jgi:flagellar protein FliS
MSPNPASIYFEAEAASIPRLKLVRMMYAGAVESLQLAKTRLHQKDRAGFVRAINKAQNIIQELAQALDFEAGGEIACSLDNLYEWMQRTLTPACVSAETRPIDDTIAVLEKLKDGFDQIRDDADEVQI